MGVSGSAAPTRIELYLIDVERRQVYRGKGTAAKSSVRKMIKQVFSDFIKGRGDGKKPFITCEDKFPIRNKPGTNYWDKSDPNFANFEACKFLCSSPQSAKQYVECVKDVDEATTY